MGLEEARQAALQLNVQNRPSVTPAQPRHPLALLESLLGSAESAAAARLEQMHGHLSVGHRASGYDGTAAQIHAQYAQALAPIVQALRAQAEAEAGLREALNRTACAWTITANSLYVNGGTEFDAGKAAGLAQAAESLTRTCAALAQAGGES